MEPTNETAAAKMDEHSSCRNPDMGTKTSGATRGDKSRRSRKSSIVIKMTEAKNQTTELATMIVLAKPNYQDPSVFVSAQLAKQKGLQLHTEHPSSTKLLQGAAFAIQFVAAPDSKDASETTPIVRVPHFGPTDVFFDMHLSTNLGTKVIACFANWDARSPHAILHCVSRAL